MSLRSAVGQYLVAAMVFLALDLVWLSFVAQGLYEHFLGDLLADSPNAVAAVVFYAISTRSSLPGWCTSLLRPLWTTSR